MQKAYEKLMRKCISLAKKGEGHVSPNPLVGAIVFDDDFNIISQGWHACCGQNHAERNAILSAKESLKDKNIIVSLEPCSHYGKTPPCADLIIESGIKKVVVGMVDPNPIVSGRGIKKLQEAGIEVVVGVLEQECKVLNEIFIKNQIEKMPFIVIKTACTLDGKIATGCGNSKWITDEFSRKEVQKMRNRYDAILTSSATVIADNPSMTCRIKGGRNPVRVVVDTRLTTNPKSKIYNDDGTRVIILTSENVKKDNKNKYPKNVEIIECLAKNGHVDLTSAVKILYKEGINSIMVEAGGTLNNAFIQENLADKLVQFIAPKLLADKFGKNVFEGETRDEITQCNNLTILSTKRIKNDIIVIGVFSK